MLKVEGNPDAVNEGTSNLFPDDSLTNIVDNDGESMSSCHDPPGHALITRSLTPVIPVYVANNFQNNDGLSMPSCHDDPTWPRIDRPYES